MPRKKPNGQGESRRPLIRIERILFEKASFKLSTGVLTNIAEYAAYVKALTGDEPSQDEIVEKGMQRLFDSDRGFRQWLQKAASNGNGNRGGMEAPRESAIRAESRLEQA